MDSPEGFYTIKGYSLRSGSQLTSAMEDYLEMAARIHRDGGAIRIIDLSRRLHVKASSATKMVQHLSQAGLVQAHKYGAIVLTEKGRALGDDLLHRHDVLHAFLCLLNHSDNELEQVEKIEHYLNRETIQNLELLTRQLQMTTE